MSPSSQRVWIEIFYTNKPWNKTNVALFTEGVDWNRYLKSKHLTLNVALFTEGVDWNSPQTQLTVINTNVALFTEGVDWNSMNTTMKMKLAKSPSSQRVWIEIHKS